MPYQPLDTPVLVQRFCIMCRAFFPDCELDIPGDGTVTATFGKLGYADMYPSVAPDRAREDPGDMLMLLHSGEVWLNDKLLWSGYGVEKFLEVLKQFNRDSEGTTKFYVRKTKKAEYYAKRRNDKRREKEMAIYHQRLEERHTHGRNS